jgi:putative ATP-binding cassette transporter
MALSQRTYLPLGSLRRALAYPQDVNSVSDAAMLEVLDLVGLSQLSNSLDEAAAWDKRLSEGEKQRLAIARALLFKPDLLLLDESTAALDEPSELALHRLIMTRLSEATVIAVSHRSTLESLYGRSIELRPIAGYPRKDRP